MEYVKKSDVLKIIEKEKALRIGYDADITLFAVEKSVHELETIDVSDDEKVS